MSIRVYRSLQINNAIWLLGSARLSLHLTCKQLVIRARRNQESGNNMGATMATSANNCNAILCQVDKIKFCLWCNARAPCTCLGISIFVFVALQEKKGKRRKKSRTAQPGKTRACAMQSTAHIFFTVYNIQAKQAQLCQTLPACLACRAQRGPLGVLPKACSACLTLLGPSEMGHSVTTCLRQNAQRLPDVATHCCGVVASRQRAKQCLATQRAALRAAGQSRDLTIVTT